jgi:hypothetical protein
MHMTGLVKAGAQALIFNTDAVGNPQFRKKKFERLDTDNRSCSRHKTPSRAKPEKKIRRLNWTFDD